MPPLIFTPEVCGKAQGPLDGLSPLVLRWAGGKDEHVERIREQIESAAALVPELQRARVLGPISPRASDDQVQAAVGGILLAKMLVDHGWTVEFEPAIGAQTPDLLIRKGSVENIVEIRRVVGRAAEDSRSRLMVQRVLEDIRTATPLNIEQLQVDGGASLKPLVAHVKAVLADRSKPTGPQIFTSPGVFVAYEVSAPGDSDEPTLPAVFGWPIRIIHGGDEDRVKTAISEKLRVYKQPIVVALDLAGVMNGFDDVIDAFYGERKIHVPIDSGDGAPNRPAYLGPMQDGMLVGRHRNAARARERLLALLPFVWGMSPSNYADGFDVLARVLANPAIEPPSMLDEFAPIPRFVVASREGAGHAMMQWVPPVDPKGWRHVP